MGKILKEDIKYISIHPNTFAHIAKSVYGRIIAGDLGDADVEEFGTGILFRFNGVGVNFNTINIIPKVELNPSPPL